MTDAELAFNALYVYMKAGGSVAFSDGGSARPMRDRPFNLSWRIDDPQQFHVIWWKLMMKNGAKR